MLYVLICQDKPNSSELRQSVRAKHLAYLGSQEVRFAGPMLSDDQSEMIGSIVFCVPGCSKICATIPSLKGAALTLLNIVNTCKARNPRFL